MVSKKYAANYTITEVDLGVEARGRVQAIFFRSKNHPDIPKASFSLVNLYLTSGHHLEERFAQLTLLLKLDRTAHTFMAGDFNQTTRSEDSPSASSYLHLRGGFLVAWEALMDKLRLSELHQEMHTNFVVTDNLNHCRSSRIDQIYSTLTPADFLLITPVAFIAPSGSRTISEYKRVRAEGGGPSPAFRRLFLSSHVPICVSFFSAAPSKKRAPNLPKWTGSIKGVGERIVKFWQKSLRGDETPFERIAAWKKATYRSVKWLRTRLKKEGEDTANNLHLLSRATTLLRACAATNQDRDLIEKLLKSSPELKDWVVQRDGFFLSDTLSKKVEYLIDTGIGLYEDDSDPSIPARLPSCYMPGGSGGSDPISKIKERLPNTRSYLTHLRATREDSPTSDPQDMGDLILGCYSKVWRRNPAAGSRAEVRKYLESYDISIPDDLIPDLPDTDDFIDAINASNNSSAGPDGIPFSIIRACNQYDSRLAECLADMARELARGILPPPGFNFARFYLLPKEEGGLVDKTRGLSVSDGVNRLIATVTAKKIEPALKTIILKEQKGFTPEREGTTHVRNMLDRFYQKLTKKQQYYILLLDTARAFDTLSHTFLHACLEKTGFPPWVLCQTRGLLHEVFVFPVLAEVTGHKISIQRGVKQGCPLSPFLFIICINVLLFKLRDIPGAKRYAFADDLALGIRSVTLILRTLELVKEFGAFSDLHMNLKKTTLVATFPPSNKTVSRLKEAGWKDIKCTDAGIYLGVLFGRAVTTMEIFAKAFDKVKARIELFRNILKTSSLHTRVQILNVFVTPILMYLGQFYTLPYLQLIVPLRELYRKSLIPFNGGAFSYVHAVTPKACGISLYLPLRDVWALNMTLLGYGFDLEASNGSPIPELGDHAHLVSYEVARNDMTPVGHGVYAAFVLLEDHAPRGTGMRIDLDSLPAPTKKAQRRLWFYNKLILGNYATPRSDPKVPTSIEFKLTKRLEVSTGVAKAKSRELYTNANIVRKMATPAIWNNVFRIIFDALPFDRKRFNAKMQVQERALSSSSTADHGLFSNNVLSPSFACHFCGGGDDSSKHVFLDCGVVRRARETLNQRVGTCMGHTWGDVLLAFPPLSSPVTIWLTTIFNYYVWHLRGHFFATLELPLPFSRAVNKLVDTTILRFNPLDRPAPRGEQEIINLATNPPKDAVVGFTDGSAYDDLGVSGAGLTLQGPGITTREISIFLGRGDNNFAEAHALLRFLQCVRDLCGEGKITPSSRVLGFSDSAGVLGYLLKGWACPVPQTLGRDLRTTYREVEKLCSLKLYWIRGHIGIPGNEEADKLAKIGALSGGD